MKVLIVIPAYNEAENIEKVYSEYNYIVVNGGFRDNR